MDAQPLRIPNEGFVSGSPNPKNDSLYAGDRCYWVVEHPKLYIYDFTKFLSHKPLERFGCKIKSENFPETNSSQLKTDSLKDVLSLSLGLKERR